MTTAFVLGNGISRQHLSLTLLQQRGKIYGCNALYREFAPDVLVATDRPIATAIQESGYAHTHRFYTRRPLADSGALQVPKEYYGYSSGPIAASLAAKDQHQLIYLLGFDLGPTAENTFNNVYAGTQFYKPSGANPTFSGNWIKQLCKIITDHPHVQFVRVTGETSAQVAELAKFRNLNHLSMREFEHHINTFDNF